MATQQPRNSEILVGRNKELDAIASALSDVESGSGRFILFAGEPGIGKSTLARTITRLASEKQFSVHWGYCWEAGGAPACWPWTQILRSLLSANPELSGQQLKPLTQLLPELECGDSADEQLPPEQARFLLLDAVRSVLQLAARSAPQVLILEDLHVADADTLRLLQYIARHVALFSILLVGTLRESEARISTDMELLWSAARDATTLRPGRLGRIDILEYLGQQNLEPSEQLVDELQGITEGNPLFLVELVSLLESTGGITSARMELPDSITHVIRAHLERLPDEIADILKKAAVIGREFRLTDLSALLGMSTEKLNDIFTRPEISVILRPIAEGCWRYSHILYRDVLHQALKVSERELLHKARAEQLAGSSDNHQRINWAEIAANLSLAGTGQHAAAVEAWRKAARQARKRLALDEAVSCLGRAEKEFGQGPAADPGSYCDLLLELAEALLVKGDIRAGRSHCQQAYEIARTMENPRYMAAAALTYGSVFVIGEINAELVRYLEEVLDVLPESEIDLRARVSARLAAALQPAPNPEQPMEMARQAIKLARAAGSDKTLYRTLRSAISALLDFADAEERLALNQEYVQLAESFNDIPEQFRGHLRLSIDAIEMGDPAALRATIDTCEKIADQIGLPHYQWKVTSCKVMSALIEGDFDTADTLLAEFEELAAAAEDASAAQVAAMQRLYVAQFWRQSDETEIRQLISDVRDAFSGMPDIGVFIQPHESLALLALGEADPALDVIGRDHLERLIRSGDSSGLLIAGEIAVNTGDPATMQQLYDVLKPFGHRCAHRGLMGMIWEGPAARVLGLLAMNLDRDEVAAAHFDDALTIARRMGSRPYIALIHAHLARLAAKGGNKELAGTHVDDALKLAKSCGLTRLVAELEPASSVDLAGSTAAEASPEFSLCREGDVWRISYLGEIITLKHSKGMAMIGFLVSHPDEETHVLKLNNLGGQPVVETGDAGPQLDHAAGKAYRLRLEQLQEQLAEAEEFGDAESADGIREEIEFLGKELSRAFGIGGRQRVAGSAAERARVNVQRRIRDAINRIDKLSPVTGKYLDNCIKTGSYCKFQPL